MPMITALRTPLANARGHGSAKEGTHHFWAQRVTAIANIFVIGFLLYVGMAMVGKDYGEVIFFLRNPLIAGGIILSLLNLAYHMKLGLQVVIEDYVHNKLVKVLALVAVIFFSLKIALFGSLSVLIIALS